MSSQLDILALEPFYGGIRRSMLETLIRGSRHRWTLLKLPPRRIERRLTTAAHWFAEQLTRHWVGRVDVLFTSEAMNLADLTRRVPQLARKPAVAYFHSNQLPAANEDGAIADAVAAPGSSLDFVNLSTANAAAEVWFNSMYHLKTFLQRAGKLVERHPELAGRSPVPELLGKSHVIPPPLDLHAAEAIRATHDLIHEPRTIFVETRDANVRLLNYMLATLQRRGEKFNLVTVGPVEQLSPDLPRTTLAERDEQGQWLALLRSGVFVSVQPESTCDYHALRAIAADCWPIVPESGVYPETIPEALHESCLYEPSPDALASKVQDVWHQGRPDGSRALFLEALLRHDTVTACQAIDERLEALAATAPAGRR